MINMTKNENRFKSVKYYMLTMICIAFIVCIIGCESSPTRTNEDPEPIYPEPGIITMVTTAEEVLLGIYGKGPVKINWNDELEVRTTLREYHFHYKSEFRYDFRTGEAERLITVKGHVTHLRVCSNSLIELDVRLMPSLVELFCIGNYLSELDVSQNIQLRYLLCDGNRLTNLDVSRNTLLVALGCGRNLLTDLDISRNTLLYYLRAHDNQLSSLDLSRNLLLEAFFVPDNRLTYLNISNLALLDYLNVDSNYLKTIIMSDNLNIRGISVRRNLFSVDDLDRLYDSLPDRTYHNVNGTIWIHDNPGTNGSNKNIAENKNWIVDYDYDTYSETNINELIKENIFLWRKK